MTQLVLGWPVCAALVVSWVCLPVSFWPAGWPVMHPLHVTMEWVHYYHLPPQHFHIHPAEGYGWWATGSFDVGYICTLPCLWDIPHILVHLDRAATPPHTPVLPPTLDFVLALEGSNTDQDHVSLPQGHCLATFIIITCMAPCLLLMKEVGLSMDLAKVFPQFLAVLGRRGHNYWLWGNSKSDINRETGLSPIHEEIGAETSGGISGTVVSMDQCSNTALPFRLAAWRQHLQHIN